MSESIAKSGPVEQQEDRARREATRQLTEEAGKLGLDY